jgi:hypothetical protein
MIDKDLDKFIQTGKVKDYLEYKRKQKTSLETAKEIAPGEKNATKRGDNR